MSNYVRAQLFRMIPLNDAGEPEAHNDQTTYGWEIHDDCEEVSDYGLTLVEAQAALTPDALLTLLSERASGLADWAARKGAYINGNYYGPRQLARHDLTLPAPEVDE